MTTMISTFTSISTCTCTSTSTSTSISTDLHFHLHLHLNIHLHLQVLNMHFQALKESINVCIFVTTFVLHFIIWLAPRLGKIKRILCSDCLPERARWTYHACSGFPPLFLQKVKFFGIIFWPYNNSFIDQACSVKMAGYWPCSFFVFLLTSTSSRSIKLQKENLANIQPS